MNVTVVFPDASLPNPTSGGFSNQEEFRDFVMRQNTKGWNSTLHCRPLDERLADCSDETLALAFPLQFPCGFTGLPGDKAVQFLSKEEGQKKHLSRGRKEVFRKLLQHSKPSFHASTFNLIVQNMMMKEDMSASTKMHCNVKSLDGFRMSEKHGAMTSEALQRAIHACRRNASVQHSSKGEHQFLKSTTASCRHLPHTNEAADEARTKCFSFLMQFGLPAVFLTITPDDQRSFRIVVCSCIRVEKAAGNCNPKDFSEDDVLLDFSVKQKVRSDCPGLCAEEHQRITQLVLKHFFNWDTEHKKSNGIGLFGLMEAWCLATEEQCRKTLHGHCLLFIENWNLILRMIQRKRDDENSMTLKEASKQAKTFCNNAASARIFGDFENGKPLEQQAVFHHEDCRSKREIAKDKMRFTVEPAKLQSLREMRHKTLCREHNGVLATCSKCSKQFSINDIVELALNTHLPTRGNEKKTCRCPEGNGTKNLDRFVHESQKDMSWHNGPSVEKSKRQFANNALVDVHLSCHATRCFKKGAECFANLPAAPSESTKILHGEDTNFWSNHAGEIEERWMFRFEPKRMLEDAFVNAHNPTIATLMACNNNIMVGMNGRSVFCVTCCNNKRNQDEECAAFQALSNVLTDVIDKQASEENSKFQQHHCNFLTPLICSTDGKGRGRNPINPWIQKSSGWDLHSHLSTHHGSSNGSLCGAE